MKSLNKLLNRKVSADGIKASKRLYKQAKEHHMYIENKMKEKGVENIRFVNEKSEEIVVKMEDRKPLYFLPNSNEKHDEIKKEFVKKDLNKIHLLSGNFVCLIFRGIFRKKLSSDFEEKKRD